MTPTLKLFDVHSQNFFAVEHIVIIENCAFIENIRIFHKSEGINFPAKAIQPPLTGVNKYR